MSYRDTRTKTVHKCAEYTLTVDVDHRTNDDGSTREVVTDWYFTSPDGKKTARVCRFSRSRDNYCRWFVQLRPHPTPRYRSESRYGLQIDWAAPAPSDGTARTHPSNETESAVWAQAYATAIEWATKKRVLRGGLAGWCECGWREGTPPHTSVTKPKDDTP
jgi:hypothetical protein